ncbi:MAG: hypothetical protein MJ041_02635 [Acidaminococcaceae bacterium]|nr:hypothetical protein [Acidaminococcaceae bacterium]
MAKNLETKIKEAKSEGELLKVLDSKDGEELTDEEMEMVIGGENGPSKKEIAPGTYNPKIVPPDPKDPAFLPTSPV